MTHLCIDREEEIQQLLEGCQRKTAERIFLVQSEGGWGKSVLLREFVERHPKDFPIALVDFRNPDLSFSRFLYNICDWVSWEKFPTFVEVVERLSLSPSVNIANNRFLGANRIDAILNGVDHVTHDLRQEELTRAFFKDIRKAGRITIIIDVFENCDIALGGWMTQSFLPNVHRSKQLTVVVAGITVPVPTLSWDARKISLKGIPLSHWKSYVETQQLRISSEDLAAYWKALEGHPLRMLQLLGSERG